VATFTSKPIVDEIIARNGESYPEEGKEFDVVRITQYTTPEGDPDNWGVVYRCEVGMGMLDRYQTAENCLEPKIIFERKELP
jgi:hypothetical protein